MFLAPNFLGGALPEFLDSVYETDTGSDHAAKFRGDRLRELEDYALKKRKHHEEPVLSEFQGSRDAGHAPFSEIL